MSDTQKKIVAEINKIAAAAKVDADFEYRFSNLGHVYFRTGFDTHSNVYFNFQDNTATFAFQVGSRPAQYSVGPNQGSKIWYIDYSQPGMEDLLLFFRFLKDSIKPKRMRSRKGVAK